MLSNNSLVQARKHLLHIEDPFLSGWSQQHMNETMLGTGWIIGESEKMSECFAFLKSNTAKDHLALLPSGNR